MESFTFPSCLGSFLEIRDGPAYSSDFIGRFCGDEKPPPGILSSGNNLRITFKYNSISDLQVIRFNLMYRAIQRSNMVQTQVYSQPINSGEKYKRFMLFFITKVFNK